jgi:predicted  nucleic acid-binding Zn-ribbon protein
MATSLNARFDADFSALQKAVAGADVHFQTFEKSASRASLEIGKLATSFRGDKLISDAVQASKAVEAIGGASKLASGDALKLQSQLSGAMDALKRQGADIPPSLQKISTELKALNDVGHVEKAIGGLKDLGGQAGPAGAAIEGLAGKFTGLGSSASILGPVGIAIAGVAAAAVGLVAIGGTAVSSLIGMVEHAADAGDQMLTLSNKTKIGVDALSSFKYVGEQTGTSLESITDAVFKMSVNLGKGSEVSQKAIKQLGLSFTEIKNARPEEAFIQTIEALSKVGNTAQQQAIGVALFGKGFKEVSQLTREDIGSLIARFHDLGGGVTQEMANAGDAVHDAMNDIGVAFEGVRLKIGAAFLPTVAAVLTKFADAWIFATKNASTSYVNFAETLDQVAAEVVQIIGATILAINDLLKSARGAGESLVSFGKALQYVIPDFGQSGKTFIEAGKQLEGFGDASKNVTGILDKLGFALGTTTAGSLAKIRDQIAQSAEAARKSQQSFSGLGDSLDAPKDKIKSLGDEMAKTIAQATKTAAEFDNGKLSITNLGAKQAEANKLFLDAAQAMQAMGTASGPLYDKFTKLAFATANWHTTLGPMKLGLEDVIKELPKLTDTLTSTDITIGAYAHNLNTLPDIGKAFGLKNVPKDLKDADDAFQGSLKKTSDAFSAFGLTSRAELQQAAIAASQNYQIVAASGTATVAQIKSAYDQMIDAQLAATGKLPTLWRTITSDIPRLFDGVVTSFTDGIGKMLSGQESFKDGFLGIWHDIQKGLGDILSDIIAYFERMFIAKITASLLAGGGIWSSLIGTALSSGVQSGVANAAVSSGAQAGTNAAAQTIMGAGTTGTGVAASHGALSGLATTSAVGYIGGPVAGGIVGWKVGRATGNYAAGIAAGAGTGAAVGSLAGPWGTVIGAGVGAIAGAWGAHKANSDASKEMREVRGELEKTFGSIENVRKQAQFVGVDIDKAFANIGRGVDGVKVFNQVIDEFQTKWNNLDAAMKRYGITLSELQDAQKNPQQLFADQSAQLQSDFKALTGVGGNLPKDTVITKMADSFNALLIAAKDSGSKIPAELEPILDRMVELGLVSDDAKNKLLGIGSASTGDLAKATEIAQKYGISLAQLGPSFEQAQISARAQDIFKDFSTLKDLNVDIGGSLAGMSDEISQFVSDAKQAGAEVPENMRPILEELLANGQLIDENGEALKDLTGIKFGKPLADQFAPVTDAIHELIDVLTGKSKDSLPGALQDGIDQMGAIAQRSDIRIPIKYDYETLQVPGGERIEAPPTATGGIVTRPQVRLVGEAGPEAIIPLNQMRGGGTQEIHVHVNMDGREVAYTIVPFVPEVLGLHGLAH